MAAPVVLHIYWAEGVGVVDILHYYFHEPIEFWALNTQQGVIWAWLFPILRVCRFLAHDKLYGYFNVQGKLTKLVQRFLHFVLIILHTWCGQ